jgi:uncharacterized protein
VRRGDAAGGPPLRVRAGQLDPAARAAALGLDPVADREEHALLDELLGSDANTPLDDLLASERPESRALALRAKNLGVDRWEIWPRGSSDSVVDDIEAASARCLVVDLGSLETAAEQAVVAEAVLGTLWRRRADREPVLVVIDEAHNVCPAEPPDAVTALATEHAVRIAAEGRKFGLYLLVSTQRPQKVHPNVLGQCDNLVAMRMNSAADLAYISDVFSFAPAGLLAAATGFGLGQSLVAGKIASHPALIRFGARLAEEGGADVPSDWASPGLA